MDDKVSQKHTINMIDRKRLVITAVKDVFSFDEELIELETINDGYMDIEGLDLHVVKMNLDSGELIVEGFVSQIAYEEQAATKKKGSLFKLFK
ncbi:MAG: sporulation protein [Epulopiscium sp. Nele67-Bin005]|nr:MAG: sporulation protein [Epulopiscium sp. Nele67-Bin005]